MATTITEMSTDTRSITEKIKELITFLHGSIQYHQKKLFATDMQKLIQLGVGVDGLDDMQTPLNRAIIYDNRWAFDALLEAGADVNKPGLGGFTPLDSAIAEGNVGMMQVLLSRGARPVFAQGTCLSVLFEFLKSRALLEPSERRIRWRYENESPDTNNTVLKRQISDFYFQEDAYDPIKFKLKAGQAIPFTAPEHPIHVHFQGKTEMLGELLSRNVSPILPVPTTTRSPWTIVQNPAKYARHFRSNNPKEELEYVGTEAENPNVLIFKMKLANKRNTGTLPTHIFIHYDFEPSKQLIEAVVTHLNPHMLAVTESLSQEMQETGKKLNQELQSQLTAVQRKLSETRNQAAEETKSLKDAINFDAREEIRIFNLLIKDNANAKEAYEQFQIGLNAIYTSALAVKGGGVTVSEGSLSLVASVLEVTKDVIELPLVGSLLGFASAATKEIDRVRQTNLFENIATMATPKEARKIFEAIARKLTMAYLLQFERLATRETAEAQMSKTQKSVQDAKEKMLNSRFKSPSEQVTAFAMLWMMKDVLNNLHTDALAREIAEKGLETVLINAVTQHQPAEGLTSFWNTVTSKLGVNAIPTQNASGATSGETWHPAEFWTAPGVVVETMTNGTRQHFTGNNTNVAKFGYRLGSFEDVQALGLVPITDPVVLPPPSAPVMPSTRLVTPPPSPVAYGYPNTPKPVPFSAINTASNSALSVPPPPYEGTPGPNNPPVPKRSKSKSPSPFARLRAAITT